MPDAAPADQSLRFTQYSRAMLSSNREYEWHLLSSAISFLDTFLNLIIFFFTTIFLDWPQYIQLLGFLFVRVHKKR